MNSRHIAKSAFYFAQRAISTILYYSKVTDSLSSLSSARILMYHNVSEFPPEKAIPYDNVSPDIFRLHTSILSREYNVISLTDLTDLMARNLEIPQHTIVITFDDGYKNNYLNAYPVLKGTGLKATFFLSVDSIGATEYPRHLLWDKAALDYVRKYPESRLPLNWNEVAELHDNGMEIGSHGITHRSIGNLESDDAKQEIASSKSIIEARINSTVRHFAYPFGAEAYGDFNNETKAMLLEAGYRSACTTEIGCVTAQSDRYQLSRIPIRNTDNERIFRQKLSGAYDWVNKAKKLFQRHVGRIDKVS